MALTTNLITFNGSALAGIREYKVQYAKLWKDAERNMSGNISASLIGIFTKISLKFRAGLTTSDITTLTNLFNTAYFTVSYFDPQTNAMKSEQFYASDFDINILSNTLGIYDEFSVNLVACQKRS